MARYIDADKIHQFVEENIEKPLPIEWFWALKIIDNAPAEDVAEAKHGYWEHDLYCSVCGYLYDTGEYTNAKDYCPNCGADMRGKNI